ncbi:MAG: WD40 repeat domain-containing protein, partial [Promethearchaeota archaeon]
GHKDEIRVFEISSNNRWLASGSWDRSVILWKIIDNEGKKSIKKYKSFKGHSDGITSLKFCEAGKYIASGSKDGTVKIWEILSGNCIFTLYHNNSKVFSFDLDPGNERILSAGEDHKIYIWRIIKDRKNNWIKIRNEKKVDVNNGPKEKIHVLKINPHLPIFATVGDENIIYLWDYPSGDLVSKLQFHKKIIYSIDFHPRLPYLISGGKEKKIFIWDLKTENVIKEIQSDSSTTFLKFNEDGNQFLTVSIKSDIIIYDFHQIQILQRQKILEGSMLTVGISKDWSILAINCFKQRPITINLLFSNIN